ncbi:substrate-binding periplasmic protein [Lysobacter fragariae]
MPTSRSRVATWLAAVLLCLQWVAVARAGEPPLRVRYPAQESLRDARPAYPLAVLKLALAHSGQRYDLQPATLHTSQSRALDLVAKGTLDLAWSVTTQAREDKLRAVRFPIDRGLVGWRVLLVRRGNTAAFAAVRGVPDLAAKLGAQGHDWPDLEILRRNGLAVAAGTTYEGLFGMLARDHIDYFPRSVAEVGDEVAAHRELPLEIEPTLLLHYPSALYFFVHPDNTALAQALEAGLERSQRDGSLERLFQQTYGAQLAALNLRSRHILALDNPLLPRETPLARPALWRALGANP